MSDETTIEWALCACGKERAVTGKDYERRLAKMTMCGACSFEFDQKMNVCPEVVPIVGGVSSCALGWKHTGRCEPFFKKVDVTNE